MEDIYARNKLIYGEEGLNKLKESKVVVFGLGGVGGILCEMLARSGIGEFLLIDGDSVDATNINRQLIALTSEIGKNKVDVMEERIKLINPDCKIKKINQFINPYNIHSIDFAGYNYICDAIDSTYSKIQIVKKAKELDIPMISCMATGNKLNPLYLEVDDIYNTKVDPVAKKIRRHFCKNKDTLKLKVVYSREIGFRDVNELDNDEINGKKLMPSAIFVPSVAGILMACEVVKDITNIQSKGINLS